VKSGEIAIPEIQRPLVGFLPRDILVRDLLMNRSDFVLAQSEINIAWLRGSKATSTHSDHAPT
jgi:hypothetical protein